MHHDMWNFLFPLFIAFLVAATLPGAIELTLLTFGALLPKRKQSKTSLDQKIAVLIPAHNEEASLAQTIESLLSNHDRCSIIVIADNCTDNTAKVAERYGARTLQRIDPKKRGKHYALEFAFSALESEGFDSYIIVDADSVVSTNFLYEARLGFNRGCEAIQTRYDVKSPETSLRHRLMRVAFLAFNYLRPRGRSRLGLSCGVLGNGFGITKKLLKNVPFQVNSVVEDLAYHLKIVEAGYQVHFIEEAIVYGEIPFGEKGAITQRARWEGGRFVEIKKNTITLVQKILAGQWRLIEPALELLLLPLGYHTILLMALGAMPGVFSVAYGLIALGIVGIHIAIALILGGGGIKDLLALLLAPFYLVWKIGALLFTFGKLAKGMAWEKTERD